MRVFVYAQTNEALNALCVKARQYGAVSAFIVGGQVPEAKYADDYYVIDLAEGQRPEDAAKAIADTLKTEAAELFLVETSCRGKFIAGYAAALLGTSALADVTSLSDELVAQRLVYGGAAVRTEKALGSCAVVLCTPDLSLEGAADGAGAVHEIAFEAPANAAVVKAVAPREKGSVDLSAASKVIGIGRGISQKEDLELVYAFADAIGAEIGCTRPIAEEEKWLPREAYIGVSGAMLSPDLYIAIGLSGQVQHTVGINQAKTVVAINKDGSAPIFKQSDLGIVGDWKTVVSGVLERLK